MFQLMNTKSRQKDWQRFSGLSIRIKVVRSCCSYSTHPNVSLAQGPPFILLTHLYRFLFRFSLHPGLPLLPNSYSFIVLAVAAESIFPYPWNLFSDEGREDGVNSRYGMVWYGDGVGLKPNWHIRCFITFRLVFGQLTTFLRLLCVCPCLYLCSSPVHVCESVLVARTLRLLWSLARYLAYIRVWAKKHTPMGGWPVPWLKMNLLTEFVQRVYQMKSGKAGRKNASLLRHLTINNIIK